MPDVEVCDECVTAAYDMGILGYEDQAHTMRTAGDQLDPHECVNDVEPELKCACACRTLIHA